MKSYLLVALLVMILLTNLFGEVRNGYEKSLPGLMLSLQGLRKILHCDDGLSGSERRSIERKKKMVIDEIAYYHVTSKLLEQFRNIAPGLYQQVDTLQDAGGKPIDVYVKFIPNDGVLFGAPGVTTLTQSADDLNSCSSVYGRGSVSVVISRTSGALRLMAHEFGHVVYVVQNMKSYVPFFRRTYGREGGDVAFGHHLLDMSGRNAFRFEKLFRLRYSEYLRNDAAVRKFVVVKMKPIRKDLLAASSNSKD